MLANFVKKYTGWYHYIFTRGMFSPPPQLILQDECLSDSATLEQLGAEPGQPLELQTKVLTQQQQQQPDQPGGGAKVGPAQLQTVTDGEQVCVWECTCTVYMIV